MGPQFRELPPRDPTLSPLSQVNYLEVGSEKSLLAAAAPRICPRVLNIGAQGLGLWWSA